MRRVIDNQHATSDASMEGENFSFCSSIAPRERDGSAPGELPIGYHPSALASALFFCEGNQRVAH
jgi:hypothetical protein